MKSLIPLLLLCTLHVCAQNTERNYVSPDPAKVIAVMPSVRGQAVPCAGSSNIKSADLRWKPILTRKFEEIEQSTPHQQYIDSVKAAKLLLKKAWGKTHQRSGERTTSSVLPAVGTNFAGNTYGGVYPLDNIMAISNRGIIVSIINSKIEYYDSTGTNLYSNSLVSFLGPMLPAGVSVCDPYVLYDPGADRFICFCQEVGLISGDTDKVHICFSKTNNPTAGWWCYTIYGDPTSGHRGYFDYPKMAVNDSEVFLSGNVFFGMSSGQAVLFQIDKLAGYTGGSLNFVHYAGIVDSPLTLLPVGYGQGADMSTGMYLVSSRLYGADSLGFYKITGNWCCSPTMSYWSVPTAPYSLPADALYSMALGPLTTDDCRMMSGMYLDGIIHCTFNCDAGSGFCGLNYNRLDVASLTNVSSIYGVPGYDYAFGGIASFANSPTDKSVMIGFDAMSMSTDYPEVRVVGCDSSMTWSGDISVKAGIAFPMMPAGRWGDYTGMSRNHSSATPSVWMSGCYTNAMGHWDTWIAEIHAGIPTGINKPEELQRSKVFPNPVRESTFTVAFSLGENTALQISLVDINGRLVKDLYSGTAAAGNNEFSFNKANLSPGVYILNIRSAKQLIRNEKIVIAN